ncbi:epoxide hydrolase 1-like [Liolophura sinensis]|uniref:epoxide hydrolase 1-like n=1 Tax=Liolophura sinensis TaxID=3198878 RepID=UPI0031591B5F
MAGFVAHLVRRVITLSIGLYYGSVVSGGLLIDFVRNGRGLFYIKKRDKRPECLDDPALGKHKFIQLENIKLHYVEAGQPGKPLMLFVHGFPEFWFSWRYQLREFQKDYRVVAIDQRGYNESDAPSGIENYTIDKMVGDLKQIIPALGYDKCVLVGHDWGGIICWAFALQFPQYIERLITLNAPHPKVFLEHMNTHWSQFRKSWYMFLFQLPYLPEFWMRNMDMKQLDEFFLSEQYGVRSGIMTKEDLEAYKYAFSLHGFTCPINYYRASFAIPRARADFKPVQVPTLTVWGNKDAAIDTEVAYSAAKHVPDYTLKIVDDASHWVQMDQPAIVNDHIRTFLKSKL